MTDLSHPAIRRVIDVASRKGVALEVTVLARSNCTAEELAVTVGADLGQIVRSIVFVAPRADDRLLPILCLVSGRNRVDAGRLAAVTGEPEIRRATARETRELTGYSAGSVPPVGNGQGMRVVMDSDLGRYPVVWAAAGTHSAVFAVPPGALRALSNAVVAPISGEPALHMGRPAAIDAGLHYGSGSAA
jgi:prolyl-tRNA editing enzyme YbaK/EbsC (Cys-tRNA(Pro) deacylase)